jgi:hypothetical protein
MKKWKADMSRRAHTTERANLFGQLLGHAGLVLLLVGTAYCGGSAVAPSADALAADSAQPGSSKDAGIGSDAVGDKVTSSNWAAACSAYVEAQCGRMLACYPVGFHQDYADIRDCEDRYGGINCETKMASSGSLVTPSSLVACVSALSAQGCGDRYFGRTQECMWKGSLPDSSPCTYDNQCQSGWCDLPSDTWCGACKTTIAVGGSCPNAFGQGCQSGFICANSVCNVTLKDGGICSGSESWVCTSPSAAGSPCITTFQCAWGNACVGGQCTPWKQLGDSCEGSYVCSLEKDESCLWGQDAGSKTCAPVAYAAFSAPCHMATGIVCAASGQCIVAGGTSSLDGTCAAPSDDGASCDSAANCRYPSRCIDGKCVTAAGAAGTCK